jgi:hypothetical protein
MHAKYRIWDWIVGLVMIAISVIVGGIIAGIFAFPATIAIEQLTGIKGRWGEVAYLCSTIFIFAILQAAGFYDFYRRRKVNYLTGKAGVFHLCPRAIQRMRTGYELQGFVDATTGKPATVQIPINAGLRSIVAILLTAVSVGAFLFGAMAKQEWALVVAGLGLIGTLAGIVLLAQVVLAYAGFIRRKI